MSGKRIVLAVLAMLLIVVGGGYAAYHWQDLRAKRAAAPPAAPEAASSTVSSEEPNARGSEGVATAPLPELVITTEPSGPAAGGAGEDIGNEAAVKLETRTKKEFDPAAADAAAEAETDAETGSIASEPVGTNAGQRSITPDSVLVTASLDAVQLSATGPSVVAGQAKPGTKVTLFANDRELATVVTDESGAWTMILEEPVAPGDYTLKLAAVGPEGGEPIVREVGAATVRAPEPTEIAEAPGAHSIEAPATTTSAATESAEAIPPAESLKTTAVEVVVPPTETYDVATVPPDLIVSDSTTTDSAEASPVTSPPPAAVENQESAVEPAKSTATAEAAAAEPSETEPAVGPAAATPSADTAAPTIETSKTTETAQTSDTRPSLVDQAGEAAEAISDMFTDWLTATSDQAEEAAKSFSIAAATYRPIAKGKGVVTISGRGPPRAEVRLFVDKTPVGVTTIADSGRWLAEAGHWVAPGAHTARAEIVGSDGTAVAGHDLAFTSAAAPEVVASTEGGSVAIAAEERAESVLLAIADVAYESMGPNKGRITVGGRAEPNARITVYADGKRIGATEAAEAGDWSLASDTWIDVGAHAIRAERVSPSGEIVESTLTEFVRPPAEAQVAAVEGETATSSEEASATTPTVKKSRKLKRGTSSKVAALSARARKLGMARSRKPRLMEATLFPGCEAAETRAVRSRPRVLGYLRQMGPGWYRVRRGDSLWRIAGRWYGDGRRYPVIVKSNRSAIRHPNLIYPRQQLYVP
jgi:nucleoid-associated protein YgaU